MHIPGNIFARIPYYWIGAGILLILGGIILGIAADKSFLAVGVIAGGIACTLGIRVFRQQLVADEDSKSGAYDDYSDQTCELNLAEDRRFEEFI